MGGESLVICDPKLAIRVLARDTTDYVKGPGMKAVAETIVGRGVVWAEGESHRRQRKSLSPAFNPTGLREMLPTMYHMAHVLKNHWGTLIDANTGTAFADVEVHDWLLKYSVDTIGITAFNHQFHALEGEKSLVYRAMRAFNLETPSIISLICHVATLYIPFARQLPTGRNNHFTNVAIAAEEILAKLLADRRKEHVPTQTGQLRYVKSLIEVLLDAEFAGGKLSINEEEMLAQMKTILMAALDPPSTAIAWVLVELARHPDIQARLQHEIRSFHSAEPTWEELHGTSLPVLNAVVMEALRLRGAIGETYRRAAVDDVLTLTEPIIDINGKVIHELYIPKGTDVLIPNRYLNCNTTHWGEDAHEFNPERWLKKDSAADSESSSASVPKRIWTFGEGARSCVGKQFSMAQMKILVFVLCREFTFDLPQGPNTPLDYHLSMFHRPKIQGAVGALLNLNVSRTA
ncbi:cytochrome P450 [Panaeolus papilionaceus]|nr:cytochrome P450 [Panaeolus papilionaceus]